MDVEVYMQAQADFVNHEHYLQSDLTDSVGEHMKAMSKAFFAVVAHAEALKARIAELEAALARSEQEAEEYAVELAERLREEA